ncbi:LPS sulfotransferase NodH [Janthinobacterium lividum]|uniref:Stf0 family sulfotransferase n=2 Tax=Oxalobacteraceae TaxID=75682 RepID=UPI0008931F7E|nr:Stf0 family sulfotransferase [Janthinobacterium sp. BJB301]OEZ51032.1 Stf0 sulfotransferase [Janthinobacterium lividum]STQ95142.1 Stf0 sulphotransferase [Janthinobacterium lividum]
MKYDSILKQYIFKRSQLLPCFEYIRSHVTWRSWPISLFMNERSPTSLTEAKSVWTGATRPTPAEMREFPYDTTSPAFPDKKLLVCAAPRASSKRLARLLLGAGIGVPLEYFNDNSVQALTERWQINKQDYLAHIFARRSANGLFASNIQFPQMQKWPYPHDFTALFEGATVVHLIRDNKLAQAASLATCMITGRWGFEVAPVTKNYSTWRLKLAARKAMQLIAVDEQLWQDWFRQRGIEPLVISTERVNRHDMTLIDDIAALLGVNADAASAQRMLDVDRGAYPGDLELKSRMRTLVEELAARG